MIRSTTSVMSGVIVGLAVAAAGAAEVALVPISISGPGTITGNEAALDGGGQRVLLEIRLSGWAPKTLDTYQARIDGGGYTSGNKGELAPAFEACTGNPDCGAAFNPSSACIELCAGGPNDGNLCVSDGDCAPATCEFTLCEAGWVDSTHPNYVFKDAQVSLPAVNTVTPSFVFGSTIIFGSPAADDGTDAYGGTLAVDVPVGAIGVFTIGFDSTPGVSFLTGPEGTVDNVVFTPATIKIECSTPADCDDLDACTTDSCDPLDGTCSNVPNFDEATFCCNPLNAQLTALSDGNDCTRDDCNPDGSVSHPAEAEFFPCGNPANAECDRPDSCDGAGACLPRIEPSGVACGAQIPDTECDGADTCDGSGSCQNNIAIAGAPCGSPTSGLCDAADSCDGAGTCELNHVPDATPCDNGDFCVVGESCVAGVCTGGSARDCGDGLSCTDDICNEATDVCENPLIGGNCLINLTCHAEGAINPANDCEECNTILDTSNWSLRPDGSECDDGNPCTGTGRPGIGVDTCTTGVCAGIVDTECNDDCAFAIEALKGTTQSNNSAAGPDDAEASCQDSEGDVWFRYTATCTVQVFMSTTGSLMTPSNDPVLSVYEGGCPGVTGVEIACDDDSGDELQAALTIPAVIGTEYLIRVAGFTDGIQVNRGDIDLNIDFIDDCLIDGACYAAGDPDPANECMECNPVLNTIGWSPRMESAPCGDPATTDCDQPDACDGFGNCEANFKPDGTECTDDGVECTMNVCDTGVCSYPPEAFGFPCGNPTSTECDDPDSCDGAGACLDNFKPLGFACGDPTVTQCDDADICDGGGTCVDNLIPDGQPCSDTDVCTTADQCQAGLCIGTPIPQAPILDRIGSLAITVTPQPVGIPIAPVALRVTSPDEPCINKFIDVDGSLIDTPVSQTPGEWGTIVVPGPEIIPSTRYECVAECGSFTSPPGQTTTAFFCDFDFDDDVDFTDIDMIVRMWQRTPINEPAPLLYDVNPCPPDGILLFLDINETVRQFQGQGYPCADPCP